MHLKIRPDESMLWFEENNANIFFDKNKNTYIFLIVNFCVEILDSDLESAKPSLIVTNFPSAKSSTLKASDKKYKKNCSKRNPREESNDSNYDIFKSRHRIGCISRIDFVHI